MFVLIQRSVSRMNKYMLRGIKVEMLMPTLLSHFSAVQNGQEQIEHNLPPVANLCFKRALSITFRKPPKCVFCAVFSSHHGQS